MPQAFQGQDSLLYRQNKEKGADPARIEAILSENNPLT
jgi:hypothetical protein